MVTWTVAVKGYGRNGLGLVFFGNYWGSLQTSIDISLLPSGSDLLRRISVTGEQYAYLD